MVSGIFVDFQIFLFLTRIIPEDVFQNQGKLLYPPPVIIPPLHRRGNYYTPTPPEGKLLYPRSNGGRYTVLPLSLYHRSTGGGYSVLPLSLYPRSTRGGYAVLPLSFLYPHSTGGGNAVLPLSFLSPRSTGGGVYCFTSVLLIPRSTGGGYTVLPLSFRLSVLPSVPRYFSLHFSQQLLMAEI